MKAHPHLHRLARSLALACTLVFAAGCSDNGGPSCSLDGGTQLAATTWPKFRADVANSGRAAVDLSGNAGNGQVLFPREGETIGPVQTTPILGPESIFVGASDGNVYVVDYQGQPITLQEDMEVTGAITGSPLLGANGVLFVPSNSLLSQFDTSTCSEGGSDGRVCVQDSDCEESATCEPDGTLRNAALITGFVAGSPNIWNGDGTTFVGSLSGVFEGVCPNGVARWVLTAPPTQSSVAIVQDPTVTTEDTPIIVSGGVNGQVRAYNIRSRQRWSFFASDDITAAIVIDQSAAPEQFFVADTAGRVFTGSLGNGQLIPIFSFAADAGITASPALGRDTAPVPTLYVADQGGTLYALERTTGRVRWTFQADGPISSSPAVAIGGASDIIVFGADILGVVGSSAAPVPVDGRVYAVRDDGSTPTLLWSFDTGYSIGTSSPSIGADGTVYIGRQGDRLGMPGDCPTPDPCTINDGGALYAIGP